MDAPHKLIGIQIQGGGTFERNYNYCVSVNHPKFVAAYVKNAVKFLTARKRAFEFNASALSTLLEYLEHHRRCIQELRLEEIVETFKAAHAI